MERIAYEAPQLTPIGTLHDITLQLTKSGSSNDVLTGINIPGQGPVGTGSIVITP